MNPERPVYVLDCCAALAYLEGEEGGDEVGDVCRQNAGRVFMHAVNGGEVYYLTRRSHGIEAADHSVDTLTEMGVLIRDDMDIDFWKDAMSLKADLARISLADCYFLAMTRRLNGIGLTTDHHEMDTLVSLNLCDLQFIR